MPLITARTSSGFSKCFQDPGPTRLRPACRPVAELASAVPCAAPSLRGPLSARLLSSQGALNGAPNLMKSPTAGTMGSRGLLPTSRALGRRAPSPWASEPPGQEPQAHSGSHRPPPIGLSSDVRDTGQKGAEGLGSGGRGEQERGNGTPQPRSRPARPVAARQLPLLSPRGSLCAAALVWLQHLAAMNKDGVAEAGGRGGRRKVYLNKMCLLTHTKPQASWRPRTPSGPLVLESLIRSM